MTAQPVERQKLRQSEKKWTPTLIQAGWLIIPSIILERQQGLGLDATDVNILLHLARHWWTSDKLPYPSKRTIAECMGINPSTVRRHLADMEKRGIIKRVARSNQKYGQQTNKYDLSGLIEAAIPFAEEAIADRERRHKEDAEKRTRKRPRLKVTP